VTGIQTQAHSKPVRCQYAMRLYKYCYVVSACLIWLLAKNVNTFLTKARELVKQ